MVMYKNWTKVLLMLLVAAIPSTVQAAETDSQGEQGSYFVSSLTSLGSSSGDSSSQSSCSTCRQRANRRVRRSHSTVSSRRSDSSEGSYSSNSSRSSGSYTGSDSTKSLPSTCVECGSDAETVASELTNYPLKEQKEHLIALCQLKEETALISWFYNVISYSMEVDDSFHPRYRKIINFIVRVTTSNRPLLVQMARQYKDLRHDKRWCACIADYFDCLHAHGVGKG